MSYPILYKSTETEFTSNGIGVLSDTVSCIVTEERNGSFELQMKYPIDGIHYSDIQDRSLIMAKPNPIDEAQPFRVYRTTKPLNGMVSIYARHISYDLSGIPVSPFGATNIVDAFQKLKTNAVTDCPFTFWTNKATSANMSVKVPSPIRSLLGGQSGSVLDVYGGEYKFDRYTVRLYDHRGTDRGVSIRYGKNLLDLEQERNCASVYTGLYPYWTDMDGNNMVTLPEKIVNTPGSYDYVNIMTIDFSEQWENAPTVGQLRARAESYIKSNNIGVPSVSLTVSHAMLEQTEEYKGMALLERIDLCDTVSIEFPKLGVSASAKANKTEFNVLLDRYESIEFGDARKTLTDTIIEQNQEVKGTKDFARSLVSQASDKLNEAMQNASGLYPTEDVQPDGSVIYYLHDKKVLEESSIVIKVSSEGIGLSSDGGKTYPYGYTVTGKMVMDFIAANGIVANWVTSGELNLGLLKLIGTICGLMQGYGATKSGKTTEGIVMYGNGVDTDGNAKPPYIIVTNAGIRGQSDADHDFSMTAGVFEVNGSIIANAAGDYIGNVTAAGNVTAGTYYALNGNYAMRDNDGQLWIGNNASRNVYLQGKPLYINEPGLNTYFRGNVDFTDANVTGLDGADLSGDVDIGGRLSVAQHIVIGREQLYGSVSLNAQTSASAAISLIGLSHTSNALWVGSAAWPLILHCSSLTSDKELVVSSDRRLKKDIEPLVEALGAKYEAVLDGLSPLRFRYKSEPDNSPYHLGYTHQDLAAALESAGLTLEDMAACSMAEEDGRESLGIAYGELVALLHLKIIRLENRINELSERLLHAERGT